MTAVVPASAAFSQARLDVLPSLSIQQSYDDNLFSSPEPGERDTLSGVAPRLELLLRARRFQGRFGYSQEAEWFRERDSLDAVDARREASAELRYDGRRGLRFTSRQSYRSTRTPGELLPTLGLELGRFPASQLAFAQTLAFGLSERTQGTIHHALVSDDMGGGLGGRSQELELGLERELHAHASLRFRYGWRRFRSAASRGDSHVFALGLSHQLGRHAQLRLLAGPRVTDGRPERTPEAELELRRAFRSGELSASYARSQLRIIGQTGVASTESATLRIARDLVRSKLRVSSSPGMFRSHHPAFDTTSYRVDSELRWSPAAWLAVAAAHSFATMRGGPLGEVAHHVASLRLQFTSNEPLLATAAAPAEEGR
jgi:hypothetical protein